MTLQVTAQVANTFSWPGMYLPVTFTQLLLNHSCVAYWAYSAWFMCNASCVWTYLTVISVARHVDLFRFQLVMQTWPWLLIFFSSHVASTSLVAFCCVRTPVLGFHCAMWQTSAHLLVCHATSHVLSSQFVMQYIMSLASRLSCNNSCPRLHLASSFLSCDMSWTLIWFY